MTHPPNQPSQADDTATAGLLGCLSAGCLGGPALILLVLAIAAVGIIIVGGWPILLPLAVLGGIGYWITKHQEKKTPKDNPKS